MVRDTTSCWKFLLYLDDFVAFSWIRNITENGLATKDGAFSSFRPLGRSAVRMFSITTTRNSELWQKIWNNGKTSVLHMTNPVKLLPMLVRSTQFFENFPKFYMKEKVDRKGRRGTKKKREASSEYLLYFYIFPFGPPIQVPLFTFLVQVTIQDASLNLSWLHGTLPAV